MGFGVWGLGFVEGFGLEVAGFLDSRVLQPFCQRPACNPELQNPGCPSFLVSPTDPPLYYPPPPVGSVQN